MKCQQCGQIYVEKDSACLNPFDKRLIKHIRGNGSYYLGANYFPDSWKLLSNLTRYSSLYFDLSSFWKEPHKDVQ